MKPWLTTIVVTLNLIGCHSAPKSDLADRHIASLDNNASTNLDPVLESVQYPNEEEKFNEVAATIAQFVTRQSQLRDQHGRTGHQTEDEKTIQNDLPRVSNDGSPLLEEVKRKYATRDVHRKTHGCYTASLEVSSKIQDDLNRQISEFISERDREGAQQSGALPQLISSSDQLGVFQPGTHYDAIVRFSNGHPGNRHDREPDARGMALKILPKGVLSRPISSIGTDTLNRASLLDILTINFPTFFVNDPEKYLRINELFLKGSEDYRDPVTSQLYQTGSVFPKGISGISAIEQKLALLSNGSIPYSPLYQKYFSMVPSRLGRFGDARAVKYSFVPEPCDPSAAKDFDYEAAGQWADWTERRDYALVSRTPWAKRFSQPFKANFPHDYLRDHLKTRLHREPACFALKFQLYRDQFSTNIEDSTDIWLANEGDRTKWIAMMKQGLNLDRAYYQKVKAKSFSPSIKVATVRIAKIDGDYPAQNTKTCEDLSFNPWNGRIDLHKPLGVVSRMKRRVYNASRRTRNTINGLPTQDWER